MIVTIGLAFAAPPTDLPVRMQVHYHLAEQARRAVLSGDPAGANKAGQQLAELDKTGLPETWSTYIDELSRTGRSLAALENPRLGGEIIGRLGRTCASCHADTRGGPKLPTITPVGPDATHMLAHQTAMNWLWLGLVANDDERWTAGASALAKAAPMKTHPDEVIELEEEVHRLAALAAKETEPAPRARMYGQILGACAHCHSKTGGGP